MLNNIILLTDGYKCTHYVQYPPKTETVYSYYESREGAVFPETTFFGLQYFLKKYLRGRLVGNNQLVEANRVLSNYFGNEHFFNYEGWSYIIKEHDGYLPIRIKAVPEGLSIPTSNVLMTIENTDPKCYWLTNYIETILSEIWYPCTVATNSRQARKFILKSLERSGTPADIDFKLHDFGFRGVTCPEQAGLGGLAHLVNFQGTDTLAALDVASTYYDEDNAGHGIPASEHSTITSWGQEHEIDAFENMVDSYPLGATISCVSDSYNIWEACGRLWGETLIAKVKNRYERTGGVLVIRLDSGSPISVIRKALDILGRKFGYTTNEKGFKVLHPSVRLLQGDGIDLTMINQIIFALEYEKWSLDNIAFGSGGGLLQKFNRDTQRFAIKCSAASVDGKWRDVFKNPVTDSGKVSKKGRLKLILEDGQYRTVGEHEDGVDILETVYENGVLVKNQTLKEIRERANVSEECNV